MCDDPSTVPERHRAPGLARLPDRRRIEQPADPLLQHYLDAELNTTEGEGESESEALGSAPTSLPLSSTDIAAIGARIALGHTKTAIVRGMPGYETRRHREFAAYYDHIASDLSTQGLVGRRARDEVVSPEA